MTQMKIELWCWTIIAFAVIVFFLASCATPDMPQDEVTWIVQHGH